jgi:hypothetical protein
MFTLTSGGQSGMTEHTARSIGGVDTSTNILSSKIYPDLAEVQTQLRRADRKQGTGILAHGAARVIMMCLLLGLPSMHAGTNSEIVSPDQKGARMTHGSGTFDVKVIPEKTDNQEAESANISRMSLDKQFRGDLEATSKGTMLSAGIDVNGSGGYVAIERVSGMLHGRRGTFVLQHSGTMTRGVPQMSVSVVPDSGTDQLVGLTGKMTIIIADGKHSYEFDYALPELAANQHP